MNYPAKLEGFEGQNIEAAIGFWSGPKLLVNGEAAPRGSKRGEMLLTRNDGRQVPARWVPQMLGLDVPQLAVEGRTVNLAEPLKWYEMLWAAIPLVLVPLGGALGAATGMLAFVINTRLLRLEAARAVKIVATAAVTVLAMIVYFLVGIGLFLLTQN